jgi:hypothetical protein
MPLRAIITMTLFIKRILHLTALIVLVTVFFPKTASAYTFDWKGSSSTAWNNSANWTRSGSGGTSTWPGQTGSADVVRIGVTAFTGNKPTLSASVSVASIQFGDNNGNSMTLTVNTGVTLTVTGSVIQDHNNSDGELQPRSAEAERRRWFARH